MINESHLIFLTNDDGFKSKGFNVLKTISKEINKNIWTFAPKENQSAKSQAITINKNINFKMVDNKEYVVTGTPSDCVILGIEKLKKIHKKNILLISGINEGVNLGYDLLYSGTVAAAREGALNGIKSVAISIDGKNKKTDWSGLEYYAPKIFNFYINSKISNNFFLNINFPNIKIKNIKGVKVVRLGERKPGKLEKINNNNYKMPSERKMLKTAKPNEDEYELRKGFITITIHDKNNLLVNYKDFINFKKNFRNKFE